ncbi:hypothetical protein EFL69_06545 [Weissella confusa]|uniref:hypothetical protein n=1 Tax=Weissella confusa TaxID=1583 RepID=UPI00223BC450|nr:hypothetical protein [Weissella confusa]MCS9992738.1 hypothetical protein [Weissella confusa]
MKQRTVWVMTIVSLLAIFLASAIAFEIKATNDLTQATKTLRGHEQEWNTADDVKVNEKLVHKAVYDDRTNKFFKRAFKIATSKKSKLAQRSSADETYGSPEAYEAIQGLSGMASSLTVKKSQMTFNEQSDGSVVGAGALQVDTAAPSDDSDGKMMHGTTDYTVLLTLDKIQGKWRVAELKLGQIKPGDNANDTIY